MTTAIDRLSNPNVPTPGHLGQATAIEQSRAVAEVQAAVVVAQQCPRDMDKAVAQMRRSCAQKGLAERAFYAFPKSGDTVTGPSIHLARDLARCWGNIQYGVAELRRDDAAGISEMQAYAWDVETNTRHAQIFIVPHRNYSSTTDSKKLTSLRDIYDNNANAGARRVREAIFAVLPPWFTEEAKELCHATLAAGSAEELAERADQAVAWFNGMGVSLVQLEKRVGKPRKAWSGDEIASLQVLGKTLKRGEITVAEAFPGEATERVSADELTTSAPAPVPVVDPDVPASDWPDPAPAGGPQ